MSAAVYPPIRFEDHRPRRVEDERQPNYDSQPVQPEPQPDRIEQRSTFRMIPDCVFDLGKSDATQLYGTMLRLARSKDYCTASAVDLAKLARLSDRQVRNMVALLTEKGMIRVEQRHVDGMKLPNTYHLIAHLIENETPDTSDRNVVPNDRNDVPVSTERSSYPSERGSDHVKKHVNEKHGETTPPYPPRRKSETEQRDHEVVAWWCKVSGARQPADKGAALNAAHALLAAGFTLDTLPGLYQHVRSKARNGVTLPLMVKWADGYAAEQTPAKPVDDENPKLKSGPGRMLAQERKYLVQKHKYTLDDMTRESSARRIAEIDVELPDHGITVQEAEAWAQRH